MVFFSTNTTYGCFLVYKMPQHFVGETKVKMKLLDDDGGGVDDDDDENDDDGDLMYLSISQSLGPDGVESSINKHKTIKVSRKRNDGWLEVNLTNFLFLLMNSYMQHNKDFDQLWPRLCTSHNEPRDVLDDKSENITEDSFSLEPRYFSNINVLMCPIDDVAPCRELIVEVRHAIDRFLGVVNGSAPPLPVPRRSKHS
ncbi:hypothetical protein L1987_57650 [Smallanthus sonchifolius]|uniref:Uncharacterized protein n=1 Tax=Smallanthus sonchifolius TaxID=185202 RepID=A0ACB9DE79_9ASTR|nr:hypothetical protein L1987_57650 [Smallanthus sonchifolius]